MPSPEPLHLSEVLPELAEWLVAALDEIGRSDLAASVLVMPLRSCWAGRGNFTLGAVARNERRALFELAGRETLRLDRPHGVPRRQWQVGITAVGGEVQEVGVVRPGVLRPALQKLSRKLETP